MAELGRLLIYEASRDWLVSFFNFTMFRPFLDSFPLFECPL